jgi:glycosyltransferase involved in cell wall biosynthesis
VVVSDLGGGGWDISAYLSTDRWYHAHLHISEYSRKFYGHADLPRAKVILGGIDTEKFSPDPAMPRERTVVFVGRLLPHKGVNDLIEALPAGLRLEVIGQPYDKKFYEHLQHIAKGRDVVFRHNFGDEELVQAYRRCLCVVLPSVYKTWAGTETRVPELLGQTLLEGMACGAPGIGTDVASLPEVVTHGQTGFIVPPNNPAALRERLQFLADNPEQAARMGHAARQRVLDVFQWPKVVERCFASYQGE